MGAQYRIVRYFEKLRSWSWALKIIRGGTERLILFVFFRNETLYTQWSNKNTTQQEEMTAKNRSTSPQKQWAPHISTTLHFISGPLAAFQFRFCTKTCSRWSLFSKRRRCKSIFANTSSSFARLRYRRIQISNSIQYRLVMSFLIHVVCTNKGH